jgi:hypothetical protein
MQFGRLQILVQDEDQFPREEAATALELIKRNSKALGGKQPPVQPDKEKPQGSEKVAPRKTSPNNN